MKASTRSRLLYCGTPGFAVPPLQALAGDPHFEIVHVMSQPDRPAGRGHKVQASAVKQEALRLGLPVSTPESINAAETLEFLRALRLDAIVIVAYGQILKNDFLALCPQKCVNLHGSLLPRWRGAAPIQRALMAGDKRSGVSLQQVVRKLDAGPVIGERALDLTPAMNAIELHDRLSHLGSDLLLEEFKEFLRGSLTPQAQDETQVTMAEKIQKPEAQIDWNWPADKIHNWVRGLALGPQAFTSIQGLGLKLHQTAVSAIKGRPGEIMAVSPTLTVACGQGSVDLLELQPESKKRMPASEFLKGFSISQGGFFDT